MILSCSQQVFTWSSKGQTEVRSASGAEETVFLQKDRGGHTHLSVSEQAAHVFPTDPEIACASFADIVTHLRKTARRWIFQITAWHLEYVFYIPSLLPSLTETWGSLQVELASNSPRCTDRETLPPEIVIDLLVQFFVTHSIRRLAPRQLALWVSLYRRTKSEDSFLKAPRRQLIVWIALMLGLVMRRLLCLSLQDSAEVSSSRSGVGLSHDNFTLTCWIQILTEEGNVD